MKHFMTGLLLLITPLLFGQTLEEELATAEKYLCTGAYKEAVEVYEKCIAKDNVPAKARLAVMYAEGIGLIRDMKVAEKYFKEARTEGNALASVWMGYLENQLYSSAYFATAKDWIPELEGSVMGLNALGFLYRSGAGVPNDLVKTYSYYKKVSELGYAPGQDNLGDLYYMGKGVSRNDAEALKWYRKAADQNYSGALLELGNIYLRGVMVEADKEKGLDYLMKASDLGHRGAQYVLGQTYYNGKNGVEINYQNAARWFMKAAAAKHRESQMMIGIMYRDGRGLRQNNEKARFWLNQAVDAGYIPANKELRQLD